MGFGKVADVKATDLLNDIHLMMQRMRACIAAKSTQDNKPYPAFPVKSLYIRHAFVKDAHATIASLKSLAGWHGNDHLKDTDALPIIRNTSYDTTMTIQYLTAL
eukprot:6181173-Pleurochrysis_carterae.AAC.1